MSNEYYPLKRLGTITSSLSVSQGDNRHWTYTLADGGLVLETDSSHKIISVVYTPNYRHEGLSLKRAKTKGIRVCRYVGH